MAQLVSSLDGYLNGEASAGFAAGAVRADRTRKVVFVFPGQGSQWPGMGRQLFQEEPVFRAAIEACSGAMNRYLSVPLTQELFAQESESRFDDIGVVQPAIFAIEVGLASLWRSWGIEPDLVIGHSMGEVAAAHVAGALTLADAAAIICLRSGLLRNLRGSGGMAVAELGRKDAEHLIEEYAGQVSVAAVNGPTSTVLAGDRGALQGIKGSLDAREIYCRIINVDLASHCRDVDPLRGALLDALADISPAQGSVPFCSTVAGREVDGRSLDAEYWWRNLREPVTFADTVNDLLGAGHDLFLEISPHPALLSAIEQVADRAGHAAAALPSLKRDESAWPTLMRSLARLWTSGCRARFDRLYTGARLVSMPLYPWQGDRCWFNDCEPSGTAIPQGTRRHAGASPHRLLASHVQAAGPMTTHHFETRVAREDVSFVDHHRIQGEVVFPAAAYLEMALEASRAIVGDRPTAICDVEFVNPLVIPASGSRAIQLVFTRGSAGRASFKLYSAADPEPQTDPSWILLCQRQGRIRAG